MSLVSGPAAQGPSESASKAPPPHRGALSVADGVSPGVGHLIHHPSTVDCRSSLARVADPCFRTLGFRGPASTAPNGGCYHFSSNLRVLMSPNPDDHAIPPEPDAHWCRHLGTCSPRSSRATEHRSSWPSPMLRTTVPEQPSTKTATQAAEKTMSARRRRAETGARSTRYRRPFACKTRRKASSGGVSRWPVRFIRRRTSGDEAGGVVVQRFLTRLFAPALRPWPCKDLCAKFAAPCEQRLCWSLQVHGFHVKLRASMNNTMSPRTRKLLRVYR